MSISLIKLALNAEREAVPKCSVFKILNIISLKHGLLLEVQAKAAYGHTPSLDDERFSGASAAWYAKSVKCSATAKTIIPQKNQIFLGDLNGVLPSLHQDIWLYPRDFIKPLLSCWNNDGWASEAFACLEDLAHPNRIESATLTGHHFKFLRPAQLQALSLVNYSSSFLWGPPGTGKTTMLGAMIAEYLHANPWARVLLVSTTNRAVDEATIAVDRSLAHAELTALRRTVMRYGPRFNPQKYAHRQHLLPLHLRNVTVFGDASTAEGEPGSAHGLDDVPDGVVASGIRLHTMTIAQAVQDMVKLRNAARYDLLVFDEASQISLAQALIVMPLGKARLFAGDPMQLAPIVQSPAIPARLWLKKSVFDYKPVAGPSVCQLIEQSRMAPPICAIDSELFYDGNLRVAQAELDSQKWHQDRKIKFGPIARHQHVYIQTINTEAQRTRACKGWIRPESADWIVQAVFAAVYQQHVPQEEILIITPFRMQRALILDVLARDNLKKVRVSTIHSEQGGEAAVVIFDPVAGCHEMSSGPEGRKSINVAISRAKAKLILTLSAGDRVNPLLAQICAIVDRQANRKPKPIAEVLAHAQYITRAIGERVSVNAQVGEIIRFSRDGSTMWLAMESTGDEVTLSTDEFLASPVHPGGATV